MASQGFPNVPRPVESFGHACTGVAGAALTTGAALAVAEAGTDGVGTAAETALAALLPGAGAAFSSSLEQPEPTLEMAAARTITYSFVEFSMFLGSLLSNGNGGVSR